MTAPQEVAGAGRDSDPGVAQPAGPVVAQPAGTAVPAGDGGEVWEPGAPSVRALAPGLLVGGVTPLVVYLLVHPALGSQVAALLVAGSVPALWVAVLAVVQRRLEPIGLIVFVALAIGALMAVVGGGAYGVKAKDAVFASFASLVCLSSLVVAKRPVMFHLAKAISSGADADKHAAFDALWEIPTGARTFRVITVAWGVGFMIDAAVQFVLDALLSTPMFLVAGPIVGGCVVVGLIAGTIWYSRRARRLGEQALAGTGIEYPSVPLG